MIDLKALGLTDEAAAQIMGAAASVAAQKTTPKTQRIKLTDDAWAAAHEGLLPPVPVIPMSNIHAQKKADKMLALAADGDFEAVAAIVVGGTNTYSKALRSYQAALLHYGEKVAQQKQQQQAEIEAQDFAAVDVKPKAKAKPKALKVAA
jgi:hypothetical protein